jgi:hypothetical protein
MKYIDILQVIAQVFPFVGSKHPQRQANERPQMNHRIISAIMFAELMNLGMAIMTAGNAVIGTGCLDLLVLQSSVFQALLLESGLEKTTAATATVVVGPVGLHINKILFAYNGFDHETQVFGDRITITFSNNLAGILYRELDFQILVPVGIDLQPAFTDPFGIIFIDVFDFKIVFDIKFFQSGPD